VTIVGRMLAVTTIRKLAASLAVVAAATGLMAFGTWGAFEDTDDYFPQSVVVHAD
jgi:hypothetical protein